MATEKSRTEPNKRYLTRFLYAVAVVCEECPDQPATQTFGVVDAASPEDARTQAEVVIVNGSPSGWLKKDKDDLKEDEVDKGPANYTEALELLEAYGHVKLSRIEIIPLPDLQWGPPGDRKGNRHL